jgi:hypothetical protein
MSDVVACKLEFESIDRLLVRSTHLQRYDQSVIRLL